ncbi:MAG: 3-dehydroquinate synthase [Candidatus Hydrogenedentes bacterium]|nr:3-dehydroquinate synthase [Candidatus Hydrogenedentota bacterium]
MDVKTVWVNLEGHSYPIHVGLDCLNMLKNILLSLNWKGKVGIITDENVAKLHFDKIERILKEVINIGYVVHLLPAGEEHKTLSQIENICTTMLKGGLDRSSGVIAFGGGVVGDIAGFFSASYMRGIPFIQIPTTIVAQVDASIGGKTGVNHPLGKNIIGAFYQPQAVIIDLKLLESLPHRIYIEGFAEIIKHAIITDEEMFLYCEKYVEEMKARKLDFLLYPVYRSCEIKADIVMRDEKEQSIRAYLNLGHTFGHAIEAVTNYTRYLHGEAVAIGLVCACELSSILGFAPGNLPERVSKVLQRYGLPVSLNDVPIEDVLDAMKRDKKVRAGTLRFILPRRIGEVFIAEDVPLGVVREAILKVVSESNIDR